MEDSKVSLKLMIDKQKNRVVFAECDKDFVDILFNFLTLPLGTIIRLIGKNSSLGSFNRLYESVQDLHKDYFETEACKTMLLQPRGASELYFEHLKLNVNDLKPTRIYKCSDSDCHMTTFRLYSLVPGAQCTCGKTMDAAFAQASIEESKDGVFVNSGCERFAVSDDLHLLTAHTAHCLTLLKKHGITEGTILERKEVVVGKEEVLSLLEGLLLSKTALSDVFLGSKNMVTLHDVDEVMAKKPVFQNEVETDSKSDKTGIELNLLINKANDEVMYAEANGEFINLLFSFLTFPLGSVIKLLDKCSPLLCAENLYKSVEALVESDAESIKSEECKTMLLNPKLAPYFGWSNQILKVDEMPPDKLTYPDSNVSINLVNPKFLDSGSKCKGGRYVKGSSTFMVTRDLVVTPMSLVEAIELMNEQQVPITSLEEKIIDIGEAEALNLMKAALISHNALTSAFSSRKRCKKHYAYATSQS